MKDTLRRCKICPNHQDKEIVPLKFTFAFAYNEYWCPACGALFDIFGSGQEVIYSNRWRKKEEKYDKKTKRFLDARARLNCSQFKYKGKWIDREDMPADIEKRLLKIVKEFKYTFN